MLGAGWVHRDSGDLQLSGWHTPIGQTRYAAWILLANTRCIYKVMSDLSQQVVENGKWAVCERRADPGKTTQSRDCSGAKLKSFSFWFRRHRRFPRSLKTARWTACRSSAVSLPHLSLLFCPRREALSPLWGARLQGLLIRPPWPVLLCKHRLPAGPGPPVSTAGVFEMGTVWLVMVWFVSQQPRRTPTAAWVCLRAHLDPGVDEDVAFSRRLALVYLTEPHAGFMRRLREHQRWVRVRVRKVAHLVQPFRFM